MKVQIFAMDNNQGQGLFVFIPFCGDEGVIITVSLDSMRTGGPGVKL
jgi:hypothetical protein